MKNILLLITMVMFISIPSLSSAQTTLDIYASQGNLNDIIEADKLPDGTQGHDIYRLVSLDTTYKFTGTITATGDITVIGVVDPTTGRPPCIQPAVLQDGSLPVILFTLNGEGIKGTFKNLYLLAKATNNTANADGQAFQVSADNIKLTVDNCVFDGWQAFGIGYNSNWDDFFITNSHFRNMVHPNQHYIGEVIRNEWPNEAYTDSMSFVGNTMLCINGYAAAPVTKFYTEYFEFIDNKVLFTFKNPLFIFNVTDAKINNNLFYATYSGGVDQAENPWWDNLWYPDDSYGVIALQPLSAENKTMFNSADTSKAEEMRTVEVQDNVYYWPTAVTDFWDAWNDTATNWIYTPTWMNQRTETMFADNTNYPLLEASGNVNTEPEFISAFNNDVLNGTTGNDIGFFEYFKQIRGGTAATDVWGYAITQVSGAEDWVPDWPLPEVSIITGVDDGEPTTAGLPQHFELRQNFPNPYNPSTTIEYTLDSPGNVSLKIYNVQGQLVKTVVDNVKQSAGVKTVEINMSEFPSGIYFYVVKNGNQRLTRKMTLMK